MPPYMALSALVVVALTAFVLLGVKALITAYASTPPVAVYRLVILMTTAMTAMHALKAATLLTVHQEVGAYLMTGARPPTVRACGCWLGPCRRAKLLASKKYPRGVSHQKRRQICIS